MVYPQMITYTSSLCMFLIATAVLFVCNLKNWRPNIVNSLSSCYLLTMLSLTTDILWSLVDGKQEFVLWNHLFTIAEHLCYGFTGYCWFLYISDLCKYPLLQKLPRHGKVLMLIPLAITSVLMFLSAFNGLIYTIDSNFHYQRGPLYVLRQIGCIYLILASVLLLHRRSHTDMPSQRRHYLTLASFSVAPTVLTTIQLSLPATCMPTTQFSVFLSLFIIYVEDQEQKITRDNLTRLRNRYEFERMLKDRMAHYKPSSPDRLFLLGGDLDHFKKINDTCGHLTGDRALQITASTLDTVGKKYDAIVARISGDEFSVLMEAPSLTLPKTFRSEANAALKEACKGEPFDLSISLGIAEYDGSMSIIELLETADRHMYEVKREQGVKSR